MKLILKNILKVLDAEVELNGITVIAGKNNTGKSTVGKALAASVESLANIEEFSEFQRKTNVERILEDLSSELDLLCKKNTGILRKKTGKINQVKEKYIPKFLAGYQDDALRKNVNSFVSEICLLYGTSVENLSVEVIKGLVEESYKKIRNYLDMSIEEIGKKYVSYIFNRFFDDSIVNYYSEEGSISLQEESKNNLLVFSKGKSDKCTQIDREMIVKNETLCVEGPEMLNYFGSYIRFFRINRNGPIDYAFALKEVLKNGGVYNAVGFVPKEEKNVMEEIILEKKLSEALDRINGVVNGHIEIENGRIRFQENGQKESISLSNMSTGLKSMALLERIINLGVLSEKSILVLDEPEIHLHPEWQIAYAEILVLLQKNLGNKLVIATHSPYFIKALQFYAKKYSVIDNTCFYTTVEKENGVYIKSVDNKVDELFKQLTVPLFEIMEDEEFEN